MKSILVVDDEAGVRGVIEDALSGNYATFCVADGKQALRLMACQNFDLVITDVLMPEMDGIELIMALRKSRPEQKFIAMSGFDARDGQFDALQVAQKLGGCLGLRKPFQIAELRMMVHQLLAVT